MKAPLLLPVFLKLAGRPVLVVGGGTEAAAKVHSLLAAGAEPVVVAPAVSAEIDASRVRVVRRAFRAADVDGVAFVVAAATAEVNRRAARAARRRGLFVNVVDEPLEATAFFGGVVRRGSVTLAVSTQGKAPALAGLLREALEALLPEDLEAWVETAARRRGRWRTEGIPLGERRPLLLQALNRLYSPRGVAP